MAKAKKAAKKKKPKVVVVSHVAEELPVDGMVVIIAKDPKRAETFYEHISRSLKQAGHDFADLFKK